MDSMTLLRDTLQTRLPALPLREAEPLSRHTSFRIGGPITLMALPGSREEAKLVLRIAHECGVKPIFLGKGTNLLVADEGVSGFAVKYTSGHEQLRQTGNDIVAPAGISLAQLAVYAMEAGLGGLAFAHGIPGFLGGAVCMNAGAYDGEMSQVIQSVTCLHQDGEEETVSGEALGFSYRHSAFSDEQRLIVSARLTLTPGDPKQIQENMMQLMERRREKQPLEFPSAGSTFKRPPGHFAAALIDAAGLKGFAVGGAQVSEKHAGFVINRGGASCADVLNLMRYVREVVYRESGIQLEPEVRFLGCSL